MFWLRSTPRFVVNSSVLYNQSLTSFKGFNDAYQDDAAAIRAAVQAQAAANPDYQVVVTGHSLGGALAVIAATDLRGLGFDATLYTYGQPRVGNDNFSTFATNNGTIYRITHLSKP